MENYEQESDAQSIASAVAEAMTQNVEAFFQTRAEDASDVEDDLDDFWDNVPI